MPTLHLIGGEKGGVGKSVVARLLAQYFIDSARDFCAFDTDRSHGALLRYYGDYTQALAVDDYASLDAIAEAAAAAPARHVLVDLAAQTHQPLSRWMDDSGVLELAAELDLRILYWNVMDSGQDSVSLLGRLLDQYGERLNYVLVENPLRDEDFSLLAASGLRQRAAALGARSISLKRLHGAAMNRIDQHGSSFWAARQADADALASLGLLERQRVRLWLKHAYQQFDSLAL